MDKTAAPDPKPPKIIRPIVAKFLSPTKALRRLSVLLSIHTDPETSQQKIGEASALSSSMVNNYIKAFRQEGLIRVRGTTNRNQSYHLTTAGRNELIQALIAYSAEIIQLYGAVKQEFAALLKKFYDEGIRSVVLYGAAETAEVLYSAIKTTAIKVTGIVDSSTEKQGRAFDSLVIQSPDKIIELRPDAIIITSFGKQEEIYRTIKKMIGDTIPVKRLSDIGVMDDSARAPNVRIDTQSEYSPLTESVPH